MLFSLAALAAVPLAVSALGLPSATTLTLTLAAPTVSSTSSFAAAAASSPTSAASSSASASAAASSSPSVAAASPSSTASSTAAAAGPTVALSYGTFQGATGNGMNSFLGMPFAQPPVGDLRFRLALPPLRVSNASTILDATKFGPSCSQQSTVAGAGVAGLSADQANALLSTIQQSPLYAPAVTESEDCLSINVISPVNATGLPVLVWIYGGGFEFGTTSGYDGTPIVARSIVLGTPVIYVSMNYRLNGFGFMPGKEINAAGVGNIGLQDQRQALRWVQANVAKFGGDPKQVTIWGESAGAISVALQMVTNGGDTEGLFRGAWSNSGAPIPVGPIENGQKYFDFVSSAVGCSGVNATLECLRLVPYNTLKATIDQTPGIFAYQTLSLAYLPRQDNVFLKMPPQQLVAAGQISHIPHVSGNCDDEGTLFSLVTFNITTNDQAVAYMHNNYAPNATANEVATLAGLYPQDQTKGAPFDTGYRNAFYPQFKRLAALQTDLVFQASRRFFLSYLSKVAPTWSYVYKRGKNTPIVGAFHGSDLTFEWYPKYSAQTGQTLTVDYEGIDYLINFVDHLNPNPRPATTNPGLLFWPAYNTKSLQLMTFLDRPAGGALGLAISMDNFRVPQLKFLSKLSLKYPM